MQKYQAAREELKGAVVSELRAQAKDNKVENIISLEGLFLSVAEQRLVEFERLATKTAERSYWYGVGQSILGSFLVFVVLGLAALAILGSRQDPRDLAKGKVNNPDSVAPATSPLPARPPARDKTAP